MVKRVGILYDVLKNQYCGVKFYPYEIDAYLSEFRKYLNNDEQYSLYASNRQRRDGENYHSTLFPVAEYNKKREEIRNFIDTEVNIEILGIGRVENGDNESYYLILESKDLNNIRSQCGFDAKDLHITIGFKQKDIFCPKGMNTMVLKL
jgi:hypothetical protein